MAAGHASGRWGGNDRGFLMEKIEPRLLLASTSVVRDLIGASDTSSGQADVFEQALPGWIGAAERTADDGDSSDWPPKKKPCGCPDGLCMCGCGCHGQRPKWATEVFLPQTEFLSQPAQLQQLGARPGAEPTTVALNAVRNYMLGGPIVGPAVLPVDLQVTDSYRSDSNGVTHVYLRQTYNGLPVLNATANVNIMPDGSILSVGGTLSPIAGFDDRIAARPALSAHQALLSVTDTIGLDVTSLSRVKTDVRAPDQRTLILNPDLSLDPIDARLMYVATGDGEVELAWWAQLRTPDDRHWYEVAVSHAGERVLFANDYVAHAQYQVYEYPKEHPNDGGRTTVVDPYDPLASPFGWHDTNGVAGPEYTVTRGNNVNAYTDRSAANAPTTGSQPDAGPTLDFSYPLDLTLDPVNYQSAAVSNLFYWNNLVHDVTYRYGFNEVAGNFQQNNYGRGGLGGDYVRAEAQDNANGSSRNNANFSTPPDGQLPRMQMYVWNQTTPQRDGDLDSGIIVHEYGHGISNRLTGGPSNASALNAQQSGGMGEGWSDFLGLMFTQKATDSKLEGYGIGTYSLGQPVTGAGIRAFRYSYDMSINPMTIGLQNSNTAVHYVGTIWSTALWDMNWLLIDKYGFDPDIRSGYNPAAPKGNTLALQLVLDGMKLQPANPTFKQARDAILLADVALTGGANASEIWQAFARRGMGFSLVNESSSGTVVQAFDLPNPNPQVTSSTFTGTRITQLTSATFKFNEAMDPASFNIADDVLLTGPGGQNMTDRVVGHVWNNPLELQLIFGTKPGGAYTINLGPNILAADNGNAMDGNANGTLGEPGDVYSSSYTYNLTTAAEGFGYAAGEHGFEPINLVSGQPGVTTTLLGSDDGSTTISLGGNTFSFYGTTYTSLFATTNGLITFGSSNTAWTNGDLTSSPGQASIAPLWDDWRTDRNVAGDEDSAVLWTIQGNRLIVEWSSIPNRSEADGAVTFQAILQLNTGTTPGTVVLNYPDVTTNNPTYSRGNSATVGIKDSGTQGARRLPVSQNATTAALLTDGMALRVAADWTPPTVTTMTASSSSWSGAFLDHLAATGQGNGGVRIDLAEPVLPWAGLDRMTVQFSEDVSATVGDFSLQGLLGSAVPTALSYDPATFTATWSIVPASAERYVARVAPVQDRRWLALDGNLDGKWGDAFERGVDVVAGDVDGNGVVNKNDLTPIRLRLGATTLSANYLAAADLNGDGVITMADHGIVVGRIGNVLPSPGSRPALTQAAPEPLPTRSPGGLFGTNPIGETSTDEDEADGDSSRAVDLVLV